MGTATSVECCVLAQSCDGLGDFADECITAADATQPLIDSFAKYQITTPGEQAALLSWMAYESGDFKYVRNHFPAPGRPGQGCRNMMMPEFVSEFASTLQLSNSDPAGATAYHFTALFPHSMHNATLTPQPGFGGGHLR